MVVYFSIRFDHPIHMNMKSILLFAFGLIVGLAFGRLALVSSESDGPSAPYLAEAVETPGKEPSRDSHSAEVAALRTELSKAREEIALLRDGETAEIREREATEKNLFGALLSPEFLGSQMKAQQNTEIAARLNRLANSLGLSDEQRKSLRLVLAEDAERSREITAKAFEAMQSGEWGSLLEGGDSDLDDSAGLKDALGTWARKNLSDEQFDEFERIEERDRIARAEQSAQFAVTRLNRVAVLSEEQKDLVFQHYAAGALGMPEDAPALDEILTPAQMEAYEENQRQEEAMAEQSMRAMGLDPEVLSNQGGLSVQVLTVED